MFAPVRNIFRGLHEAFTDPGASAGHEPARLNRAIGLGFAFLSGVTHCAACSGFWFGCGLGLFGGYLGVQSPWGVLSTGIVVMGINALVDSVIAAGIAVVEMSAVAVSKEG